MIVPEASLNRLSIDPPPHLEDYRGKTGRDLLSGEALTRLKNENLTHWPQEGGKRIALLLYTLKKGSPWKSQLPNSRVKAMAGAWKETENIFIGGGHMTGNQGKAAVETAKGFLKDWGVPLNVERFSHPREMPLMGAERGTAPGSLILDFGHGTAKGRITGTEAPLPPFPMNIPDTHYGMDLNFAQEVYARLNQALIHFYRNLKGVPPLISCSVAAYMEEGILHPNHRGGYCKLILIDQDFNKLMEDLWTRITGQRVKVQSFHDGTAAARNLQGSGGVLIFGTAIGYGLSPVRQD